MIDDVEAKRLPRVTQYVSVAGAPGRSNFVE